MRGDQAWLPALEGTNTKRYSDESPCRGFKTTSHQKAVLGEGVELLWRRLEEEGEVELILSAPTTRYPTIPTKSHHSSWVGLGWRPSSTPAACHSFPSSLLPPK